MDYEKLLKEAIQKVRKPISRERFKFPSIELEFYSNKTIIKNFSKIASTLRRDEKHISKFLMNELASPGHAEGGQLVLLSKLSREIIEKKVETYIKEYVTCKVCGEPDTKLLRENRILFVKCEACGAKYSVRS